MPEDARASAEIGRRSFVINLEGIYREYTVGDEILHALDGIDLSIALNEYIAIVGPSGSGKSTMMNIIGCLDRPTKGRYVLNGHEVGEMPDSMLASVRNRQIGFIFQSFNLLPRATALENVMQPLVYRKVALRERRVRALEALERVQLGGRVSHYPNQLSGGQRQRVAIARALVGKPAILLADEPTGNLDSRTSAEMMSLFEALHSEGQTIVMVTHEVDIAARCQRIVELVDGQIQSDKSIRS